MVLLLCGQLSLLHESGGDEPRVSRRILFCPGAVKLMGGGEEPRAESGR